MDQIDLRLEMVLIYIFFYNILTKYVYRFKMTVNLIDTLVLKIIWKE